MSWFKKEKEVSDFISQNLLDELENIEYEYSYDIRNNIIYLSYIGHKNRFIIVSKKYSIKLDEIMFDDLDKIVSEFIFNVKFEIKNNTYEDYINNTLQIKV